MAFQKTGETLPGIVAAADFTAAQHRFVTIDSSGDAALTGDGAIVDAVMSNNPDLGQPVTLEGPGSVAKVEASAAIAQGASVASAANGQAKTAATTNYIAGRALTPAGGSGELISVWFTTPGRLP